MIEKRLIYGEGSLVPTLTQEKKITLRKYRKEAHDFKEGEYFIGEFADGPTEIVLRTTHPTEVIAFYDLTEEVAWEDGFAGAEEAFEGLKKFYPDLSVDDQCAVIRYEVPKIADVPTVRIVQPID